jgi:hypothetical protein
VGRSAMKAQAGFAVVPASQKKNVDFLSWRMQ